MGAKIELKDSLSFIEEPKPSFNKGEKIYFHIGEKFKGTGIILKVEKYIHMLGQMYTVKVDDSIIEIQHKIISCHQIFIKKQ